MPVLTWQEHVGKSWYASRLGSCKDHPLTPTEPVEQEAMMRFGCDRCGGTIWVAWWPSREQGADADEFIAEVERVTNERTKAVAASRKACGVGQALGGQPQVAAS